MATGKPTVVDHKPFYPDVRSRTGKFLERRLIEREVGGFPRVEMDAAHTAHLPRENARPDKGMKCIGNTVQSVVRKAGVGCRRFENASWRQFYLAGS